MKVDTREWLEAWEQLAIEVPEQPEPDPYQTLRAWATEFDRKGI